MTTITKRTNFSTGGKEFRTLLTISLPLAAAYLAEIAMMVTDIIIVGRLGSVELAAVGLAGDIFFEFLLIAMGVVSIVSVLVAQAQGVGYWIFGIGGACVFCFVLGLGGPGLWWGLALGLAMTALLLLWRFNHRMGKELETEHKAYG